MMQSTGHVIQQVFLHCMDDEQFRSRIRYMLLEHDLRVLEPTFVELYKKIDSQEKIIRQYIHANTQTSE